VGGGEGHTKKGENHVFKLYVSGVFSQDFIICSFLLHVPSNIFHGSLFLVIFWAKHDVSKSIKMLWGCDSPYDQHIASWCAFMNHWSTGLLASLAYCENWSSFLKFFLLLSKGCIFSCFNDKRLPHCPLALHHTQPLRRFNSCWRKWDKDTKHCYCRCWETLPSWPNAVHIPPDHAIYFSVLAQKLWW
jgi:hypothetical protein